jgi:hypothetical protein
MKKDCGKIVVPEGVGFYCMDSGYYYIPEWVEEIRE